MSRKRKYPRLLPETHTSATLWVDTFVRVSHELTESVICTSFQSSLVEQFTTTPFISTTKLHNRHTGDYPVDIVDVERSSIPIASESDPRIKLFLKGPAESKEAMG